MEKNELKKEIDVLIESIKKQADRMNLQNNLSMVELEVLHHKIQKLYEKSILIHHLPAKQEPVPAISTPSLPRTVNVEERISLSVNEEPISDKTPKQEPAIPVQAVSVPEPEIQKTQVESAPPADLFGSVLQPEQKTVVKAKPEKDRIPKMLRKPVTDLQKAISINDKFRFINELFDGNATEFHVAVNQVNSCGNYEDADRYVSNIRDIYGWKEENEVVGIFLELVERRFL
jgi:hypothetical protein